MGKYMLTMAIYTDEDFWWEHGECCPPDDYVDGLNYSVVFDSFEDALWNLTEHLRQITSTFKSSPIYQRIKDDLLIEYEKIQIGLPEDRYYFCQSYGNPDVAYRIDALNEVKVGKGVAYLVHDDEYWDREW